VLRGTVSGRIVTGPSPLELLVRLARLLPAPLEAFLV